MTLKNISTILLLVFSIGTTAIANNLVILHTNDTHSLIEPDKDGKGGALQRKAIIDSVRNAEKNVILIDAGDMVQGSLYFKFFKGDVEYPLMNMMGYDIRILGNHEFDNGIEELAKYYYNVEATPLSANYDFTGTQLEGVFSPYAIKEIEGKKIGFIGLNVDPEGLIARANIGGMAFNDIIKTANSTARYLKKNLKCDYIIAVTHIGYIKENDKTTDVELAKASRYIDIIIGGHSHTLIDPKHPDKYPHLVNNAEGKPVVIAQTGKYGKYIGQLTIDLGKKQHQSGDDFNYTLIPVTDRFSNAVLDQNMVDFLSPYKAKVDSINKHVIAKSLYNLNSDNRNGGYANLSADYAHWYGKLVLDSLPELNKKGLPLIGIMNVGGIRQNMPEGDVTEGEILSTFPFANHMVLMELSGKDLLSSLRAAVKKGGECISENIRVITDGDSKIIRMFVDDKEVSDSDLFLVSTIDYLSEGNDDFIGLANGEILWRDNKEMCAPVIRYIKSFTEKGLPIAPDQTGRFQKEITLP